MLHRLVPPDESLVPAESNISPFHRQIRAKLLILKCLFLIPVHRNRGIRAAVVSLQTLVHVPRVYCFQAENVRRHDSRRMCLPDGRAWGIPGAV